tara:strand:+ start:436 stop:660 length:225 start_codon:yes stop_codon:yes gene_type:complete
MTALAPAPIRPTEAMKRCNALQVTAQKTMGDEQVYAFLNNRNAFETGMFRGRTPASAAMDSEKGLQAALTLLPR